MKKRLIIFLGFGLIIFALIILLNRQKYDGNIANLIVPETSTKTVIPTETISPVKGTSAIFQSKCHAIQIDTSDPQSFLPDTTCTPGVIDTAITQENIDQTICMKGYTKSVRPKVSYTNNLKRQQIIEYGYLNTNVADYEEDHLISLELGGSPSDPKNLWPEPGGSPNKKDKVENYLHSEVCSGKISLIEAQKEISTNWYSVYKQLVN
jgi:hypothetical protein